MISRPLGEFLGTCLILLLILVRLVKKMLPQVFLLQNCTWSVTLSACFLFAGEFLLVLHLFIMFTTTLICSLSRPLTTVLLFAFILMYHAFIAHIVHFLKTYDYLFLFLCVSREINHC